jgi:hypothetical protein
VNRGDLRYSVMSQGKLLDEVSQTSESEIHCCDFVGVSHRSDACFGFPALP